MPVIDIPGKGSGSIQLDADSLVFCSVGSLQVSTDAASPTEAWFPLYEAGVAPVVGTGKTLRYRNITNRPARLEYMGV